MVSQLRSIFSVAGQYYQARKLRLNLMVGTLVLLLIYFNPQQFVDLWMTRDQQGMVLFKLGRYDQASLSFNDTRWRAYSLYASEQFDQAATLYSQFDQSADKLARANAQAHARRYVNARDSYAVLLASEPGNKAAQTNLERVQKIIDEVNRLSESQRAEEGDSPKELGNEPQTGDGAKKEGDRELQVEQLDAEQLLLDPALNEMWLRQVQKNPAQFLASKFHMQLQKRDLNESEAQK